jgi:hypothetical protein
MKSKTYLRSSNRLMRHGISLFEVLVAILVAAIGVFGVIVLIPFAWETAERGIDRENAIGAAKNYVADMQAYGYHRSEGWFDDVVEPQTNWGSPDPSNQLQPTGVNLAPYVQPNSNVVAGWPYVIDPLQTAQQAAEGQAYGQFPQSTLFSTSATGRLPLINLLNLRDSNGLPFTSDLARRIAWQQDDLVFKEPLDELGPPRQAYFSMDTLGGVKRQYEGRYALISFVVPMDDARQQYRMYTLVGKAGNRDATRVFQLTEPPAGGGPNRGYQGVLLGGGDVIMTESDDTVPEVQQRPIRNGDWFLLVNYHRTDTTQDPSVDPMFDDIQLDFYQALNASATSDNPDDQSYYVTLQGADFDVFRDWDPTPGANATTNTVTYAILIPNVLAVYERTFRAEQPSLWTNQ